MTNPDEHRASPPSRASKPFELSGGALCLNFANTWGNQGDDETDRLRCYEDLLAFARQTELLGEETSAAFCRAAAASPKAAADALAFAHQLRSSIYRIFSARAADRSVSQEDVETINGVLGQAISHRRLAQRDGDFEWTWTDMGVDELRAPTWAIIESVAALLTTHDTCCRVRECNADDCSWLFLDGSRSGSRRWCSMKSCGNRAKARRHYHRSREC